MSYQPQLRLPNEFALAAACCRWTYSGHGADEVARLANQADWGNVVAACRRHRVQALVWNCLHCLQIKMPAAAEIAIEGDAQAVAKDGLRAARESLRLSESFARAGIKLLFLKGLALGRLAYREPYLKAAWDIDLLIRPQDVDEAAVLLGRLGYAPMIPSKAGLLAAWHRSRKESVWRGADGTIVELHGRVADQDELLPSLTAESPSQLVEVGAGISIPTFADEEQFAYLCVHGASSAWFRLKWITDLAAWLHRRGPVETERLFEASQRLGSGRAAAQGLLLANWLYGTPLTPSLASRLGSRANRWLAKTAMHCLLAGEPTGRPLGTLRIHLSPFFLKPGVRYKIGELGRQLRVAAGIY